jgi:hypothetical protein
MAELPVENNGHLAHESWPDVWTNGNYETIPIKTIHLCQSYSMGEPKF